MELNFAAAADKKAPCNCDCGPNGINEIREKTDARAALATEKSDSKPALSKEIAAFEDKTAVEVVRKGQQFEYKISFHGKDKVLSTSDASAMGLDEAEKKIAELVEAKQKELESTFKVAFSKSGDDVVKQWVEKADCSWERGDMVKARSPNLIELYGIQEALYRCQPSDITKNGDGVKFHFLESNYYKDQPVLAYFVAGDKDNRPSVYFEPGANKSKPATELDADRFGRDHLMSIEALTTHELSHNHQAKTGWNTSSAELERISKSIGWLPFADAKSGSTGFLLKGKADGEFYRYGKDNCKDAQVWVKSDKDGNPLNEKGEKAGSFKDAKHYKRNDVAANALVKPLTYYFPSPKEMFAEGLMLFRLGNKRREELLRESPAQYKAAKEQDQVEIDQRYGKNESGSKYIRGLDGHLKANSESEQKAVKEFEDRVQHTEKKIPNATPKEATKTSHLVPKPILPVAAPGLRI